VHGHQRPRDLAVERYDLFVRAVRIANLRVARLPPRSRVERVGGQPQAVGDSVLDVRGVTARFDGAVVKERRLPVLMFPMKRESTFEGEGLGPPLIGSDARELASSLGEAGRLPEQAAIAAASCCAVGVELPPVTTRRGADGGKKSNSSGPAGHMASARDAAGNSCMPSSLTCPPIDSPVKKQVPARPPLDVEDVARPWCP
jgi:hypothetical protein